MPRGSGTPATPRPVATEPLRVLHVTHPSFVGGLERVVHALASGHVRRGLDVRVAAVIGTQHADVPFVSLLEGSGVPVDRVPLPGRAYLQERRAVGALLRRFRPHVLHTHGDRGDVLSSPVARQHGVATVVTDHGSSFMPGLGRVYEFLQRRTFRRFDGVVVVSRALADRARRDGVAESRLFVVPNGWQPLSAPLPRDEARHALGIPGDGPVVGWVARMIPIKHPQLLVRAAVALGDPRVTFVMIGDGPERAAVEAAAERAGVRAQFVFAGAKAHAAPLVSAFDVWVQTSRSEGTPIALFEAIAAAVPVVATAVGGVPDVLGANGRLVPSDAADAMAAAIRETLGDPTARERAIDARTHVLSAYAVEPWLASYERIYAHVARRA